MATPTTDLGFQNFFQATLTGDITASSVDILMDNIPNASQGFLVIEPDSSTNREVIFYTSKTALKVVCPSAADGRGQDDTTAVAHSTGATVIMAPVAGFFEALQDASASSGLATRLAETTFDFVASGCVWSGDAYGSTRNASMTAGVVYINGKRIAISAVSGRTFTASKDTYIDVGVDGTIDYNEVNNNSASPALASDHLRLGIVVTGASNIANAGSVNQGQENKVLPIASSIPYAVTDSIGNLICPRDPFRRILGQRIVTSQFNVTSASLIDVTGLNLNCIVPAGRKVIAYFGAKWISNSTAGNGIEIQISDVTSSVVLGYKANTIPSSNAAVNGDFHTNAVTPAAAGARNYKIQSLAGSSTGTLNVATGSPLYIRIELA